MRHSSDLNDDDPSSYYNLRIRQSLIKVPALIGGTSRNVKKRLGGSLPIIFDGGMGGRPGRVINPTFLFICFVLKKNGQKWKASVDSGEISELHRVAPWASQ